MRTLLTIDIGNTLSKACVVADGRPLTRRELHGYPAAAIAAMARECGAEGIAISSVAAPAAPLADELRRSTGLPVVALGPGLPLPIDLSAYDEGGIGPDRVAAAAGADSLNPGNSLVVDAGTAITADLVASGKFMGGNISPGLRLRFKSLNDYTSRLPLVGTDGDMPLLGCDTPTAIRAGVVQGAVAEIAFLFNTLRRRYSPLRLFLTGGDAPLLSLRLADAGIEATVVPALVPLGLAAIFDFNTRPDAARDSRGAALSRTHSHS